MADVKDYFHQRQVDISHNVRVKIFPDGGAEVLASDVPVFRDSGWESDFSRSSSPRPSDSRENMARSMRRARAAVRDISRCTPFSYFVTLTLNADKIDRYDDKIIVGRLNTWLDNQVRRKGLAYVLVPERHKDGAIHFHGFFNDALPVVDSGHTDAQGHAIYNLPSWDFGFTTAIGIYGDYARAVGYVCKYIGKQGEKIGGRWYYSGGALRRPEIIRADGDFSEYAAHEGAYSFEVPQINAHFVKFEISGKEVENNTESE